MAKTRNMDEVPTEQELSEYLEICLRDLKRFPNQSHIIKERIKNATRDM